MIASNTNNDISSVELPMVGSNNKTILNSNNNEKKTATFRGSFSKKIKQNNMPIPFPLYLFLSMGTNQDGINRQEGEYLEAFVDLLNRYAIDAKNSGVSNKIKEIYIVLSGKGLHECYIGEEAAAKEEDEWIAKNINILQKLHPSYNFNKEHHILYWQDMVNSWPEYRNALTDIKSLYNNPQSAFKEIVEKFAAKHYLKYKRTDCANVTTEIMKDSARDYLFRECAMFLVAHIVAAYPAPNLNDAVDFVRDALWEKYKDSETIYLGYDINDTANKKVKKPKATTNNNTDQKDTADTTIAQKKLPELKKSDSYSEICNALLNNNFAVDSSELKEIMEIQNRIFELQTTLANNQSMLIHKYKEIIKKETSKQCNNSFTQQNVLTPNVSSNQLIAPLNSIHKCNSVIMRSGLS
jgi:hypothetical protein